jgi:hypothetical protein
VADIIVTVTPRRPRRAGVVQVKKLSPTQEAMLRGMARGDHYCEHLSDAWRRPNAGRATLQSLRRLNYVWGFDVTNDGHNALRDLDEARKAKR